MVQRVHPAFDLSEDTGLEKPADSDHVAKLKDEIEDDLEEVDDAVDDVDEVEEGQKRALRRIKSLVQEMKDDNQAAMMQSKQRRRACFNMSAWNEEKKTREKHGHSSWESRILRILHHPVFQTGLIILLLIDVKVVIIELFLEAQYPDCKIITADSISCVPKAWVPNHRRVAELQQGEERQGAVSWFADESSDLLFRGQQGRNLYGDAKGHDEHDEHHGPSCPDANHVPLESAKTACDKHKRPVLHKVHDVLVVLSVFILSMFLLELLLLLACLRCEYCRNPLYVGDMFIVVGSLILEFILRTHHQQSLWSLLLFARFWRFVRVAHGLITSVHEPMHHKLEHVEESCEELASHVDKLTSTKKNLEKTVISLSRQMESIGLKVPEGLRIAAMPEDDAGDARPTSLPVVAKEPQT